MSYFPVDFQDGVNDLDVGVNESVFFSFVYQMTHMNGKKCYWMLILKNAKFVFESGSCANAFFFVNECISALLVDNIIVN